MPAALPGRAVGAGGPIAPNLANTIDSIYIAVEPWVQYGFEVATAVVRWIPYVGWFAGLIMDGYFFVESLVASGVFNFTDFFAATAVSPRTWSISASTSAWRSSGWDSTR